MISASRWLPRIAAIMHRRSIHRTARIAAGLVVLALCWTAGPASGWANEEPAVVIESETTSCPDGLTSEFLDELRLRTSSEIVSQPLGATADAMHTLTFRSVTDTWCEVEVQNGGEETTLVVGQNAQQIDIASAATRVAWILDGDTTGESHVFDPGVSEEEQRQYAAVITERDADRTGGRVARTAGGLTSNVEIPRDPLFSADAVGGLMWVPSAGGMVPVARIRGSWNPRPRFRLGVGGRLPMGVVAARDGGVQHRYRPWSMEATAGLIQPVTDRIAVEFDGGIRLTVPSMSTRDVSPHPSQQQRLDEAPVEETPGPMIAESNVSTDERPASWSILANAAISYPSDAPFGVRLDVGAAYSPSDRGLYDDQRAVLDLGRTEFDLLMGFQWRF